MFVVITWHIWRARNEDVFENKYFSSYVVVKQSSTLVPNLKISSNQFNFFNIDPVNGCWCKPPPGYLKLYIDGGFNEGKGTFGGILCDDQGN